MNGYGMLRVAALTPRVRIGNPEANADSIGRGVDKLFADGDNPDIVVTPELGITAYTCGDLFLQKTLLEDAWHATLTLAQRFAKRPVVLVVGLPVQAGGAMFNCAAVLSQGEVCGLVPKQYPPNYKEFYEIRHFHPADGSEEQLLVVEGKTVPFGIDLLFRCNEVLMGVEICEDLWTPLPPSSFQAVAGANVLVNLSASNETVGKSKYRRQLVEQQSARCIAGYVYACCGDGESTSDVVWGGHNMVAENGKCLVESERFRRGTNMIVADIDIDLLQSERRRTTSFAFCHRCLPRKYREVEVTISTIRVGRDLKREINATPFVPAQDSERLDRCQEIFSCQVMATATRLESVFPKGGQIQIGVSGGLDSTLALLVAAKTCDDLGWPRCSIVGTTMPGFGTTSKTRDNAHLLMKLLGVTAREIDIRPAALMTMLDIGHRPFGEDLGKVVRLHTVGGARRITEAIDVAADRFSAWLADLPAGAQDLTFENVQARARTNALMNSGFVLGTGDMSELALGWCTYNADHMSMYNPNVGLPKTLVRSIVRYVADHVVMGTEQEGTAWENAGPLRQVLLDILGTAISPELLPLKDGKAVQLTEESVGPYELHDFFLATLVRYGFTPEKVVWLAEQANGFSRRYDHKEIRHWLKVFLTRFFANQFKRNCLPDGPKVGSVGVSPRGDWRMPSDADHRAWTKRDEV